MPTLARRQDGCYIVRGFHGGYLTWQIAADGVRYLQRKGVEEEDSFSNEIFFRLREEGWVHAGDRPSTQPLVQPGWDRDLPLDLRAAIRDFHVALKKGDAAAAQALTLRPVPDDEAESAGVETSTEYSQIDQWKPLDGKRWQLPPGDHGIVAGEDLATVTVRIWSPELDSPVDHREHWLNTPSGWRVLWTRPGTKDSKRSTS